MLHARRSFRFDAQQLLRTPSIPQRPSPYLLGLTLSPIVGLVLVFMEKILGSMRGETEMASDRSNGPHRGAGSFIRLQLLGEDGRRWTGERGLVAGYGAVYGFLAHR